ncbi:TonB-dependent receptor [Spongiibacter tropicus]|uniref:TonB-dependent receptor n=1 Tax=Spongiibacter tropicus TaxID=454602 RepID=UPI0023558C48|nr:TonB-dependent receptor [Spongiibacter tropicus]|tara:strand:+ start:4100 stop:6268 length:2169 start_codon:yes stop_codon:yes gene_type:complete
MRNKPLVTAIRLLSAVAAGSMLSLPAIAQNKSVLLEEVLVTGTKKAEAEKLQDVPIAATAFGEDQLEALFVRDLQSLSYTMPNVSMDDVGTAKGVANFSFRGLGVNSSIPSIDPTVGVFIDGVYQGTNSGVVFDQFDMEGIEVLRGPQGILFGRNVTGGAVLVRTTDPTEEFRLKARASMESGNNRYISLSTSGSLVEGKLLGKFAVYFNKDGGYFENRANDNDDFGESYMRIVRGGLTYLHAGDANAETTLKYEQSSGDGDGPAGQNHALFDRDTFDFAVDEEGSYTIEWDRLSLEHVRDVGEGRLTNIFGWKDLNTLAVSDIDASPTPFFHSETYMEAEQFSNELRYNILLNERFDVTAGLYYFTQDLLYIERRILVFGTTDIAGGGEQETETWGAFAAVDYKLSDTLSLIAGLRYTDETKDAKIATIPFNGCSTDARECTSYDFEDEESWSNVSPKVGLQWYPFETTQIYASYSQGFRSGGYNQRNTVPGASPGPFDEEKQDSLEVGVKVDAFDGRLRVNAAVFQNEIEDMQREVNFAVPGLGVGQVIVNSADATITGAEFELLAGLGDHLVLSMNAGYLDGDYDTVREDLNRDGVINGQDKSLALPRLAQWTYGTSVTWQYDVNDGDMISARVGYNHRDPSAYTDDNLGVLNSADMVDAAISYNTKGGFTYTIFGKNLKDEVTHGNDTQLPAAFGGPGASFAPLNKGVVYGAEIKYSF